MTPRGWIVLGFAVALGALHVALPAPLANWLTRVVLALVTALLAVACGRAVRVNGAGVIGFTWVMAWLSIALWWYAVAAAPAFIEVVPSCLSGWMMHLAGLVWIPFLLSAVNLALVLVLRSRSARR